MSENIKKTLKIEIEGTDGAGKSTGMKYLVEQAKKYGKSVVETREVGNPHLPTSMKLRELVLDRNSNLSGESMEFIFSAMRVESDKWLDNLKKSDNPPDLVVSDRGWLSHLAYTDHNVSPEFTSLLYGMVEQITQMPDIVIYFDVNTETALKRRVKRGEGFDVIESKGVEFQEKVRGSFGKYIKEILDNPKKYTKSVEIFVVDANKSITEVQAQLDSILESIMDKK